MASPASKRGLSWPWNNPKSHFTLYTSAITAGKLSWLTNWELWKPEQFPPQLEYVPMLRTAAEIPNLDPFLSSLWPSQRQAGEHRHFLGLNEPDVAAQANLSVDQALAIWKEHVVPARAKFKFRLGAPAVSSSSEGREWLRGFWAGLGKEGQGKIAFLPVHWYGSDVGEMERYLRDVCGEFGKKIWVTEFACVRMDGRGSTPGRWRGL